MPLVVGAPLLRPCAPASRRADAGARGRDADQGEASDRGPRVRPRVSRGRPSVFGLQVGGARSCIEGSPASAVAAGVVSRWSSSPRTVRDVDPDLLHPAVHVAHDELAEAEPVRRRACPPGTARPGSPRSRRRPAPAAAAAPRRRSRVLGDPADEDRGDEVLHVEAEDVAAGSARRPARRGSTCGSRGRAGPGTTGRSASPP